MSLSPTVRQTIDRRHTSNGGSTSPTAVTLPPVILRQLAVEVARMQEHARTLEAQRMKPAIVQTNPKPPEPRPLIVASKRQEMPARYFWPLSIGTIAGMVALFLLTHGG